MLSSGVVFIIISWIPFIWSNPGFPYEKPNYPVEQVMSPFPLKTWEAKEISLTPMEIFVKKASKLQLFNNGVSGVEGYPLKEGEVILRGGIAMKDEYALHGFGYYNDGVPEDTRTAVSEDNKGTALTQEIEFYNKKYGSPLNALNYSDGFIIFLVQVKISGDTPNPHFEPYGSALKATKQPYSKTVINAGQASYWVANCLTSCDYHFSWPGTNFNSANSVGILNKQYPAAVAVQIPRKCSPRISHSQFQFFANVLNKNGQKTTSIIGQFPRNDRPVVKVTGGIKFHYHC